MKKELLKRYIGELIKEEMYWVSPKSLLKKRRSRKGIFQRIMDLFSSDSEVKELVDEWLEDQSYYYDFEPSDAFVDEVTDFAKKKLRAAARKTDDEDRAKSMTKNALDRRYRAIIARESMKDDDD